MSYVFVSHDLKRKILEISSLIRVINNYYFKKLKTQEKIKPLLLKKFKDGLDSIKERQDWLFSVPNVLSTLSDDLLSKNDSFRFPDSILLFESWMNLGLDALYPQFVLHFKFPGYLKKEKTRHIFQFIFSTSRGFGFPIYFAPEFYGYNTRYLKYLEPIFEWCYGVCHMANQATFLVDNRLNLKRHHPGEFESVILSEFENHMYKSIDTLFHGYFTNEPKKLGNYKNFNDALKNLLFVYSIGDHAISLNKNPNNYKKAINFLSNKEIKETYDVNFYSYVEKLLQVEHLLIQKIAYYKKERKKLIREMSLSKRIMFYFSQSKRLTKSNKNLSKQFSEIDKYSHYERILEKIIQLFWTTPLYSHTIHDPNIINVEEFQKLTGLELTVETFNKESADSIIMNYIHQYTRTFGFKFEDKEVIDSLKKLRDKMAKMWLYFKERQFKYAVTKINQLSDISLDDENYKKKIMAKIQELIPIISIYELFNRPLSKSVYPESIPQTKRLGAYLAKFLTSRYNIIGLNLIRLFNRLAYKNWIYFIQRNNLNLKTFFRSCLNLPIWKHIPKNVKELILSNL